MPTLQWRATEEVGVAIPNPRAICKRPVTDAERQALDELAKMAGLTVQQYLKTYTDDEDGTAVLFTNIHRHMSKE